MGDGGQDEDVGSEGSSSSSSASESLRDLPLDLNLVQNVRSRGLNLSSLLLLGNSQRLFM